MSVLGQAMLPAAAQNSIGHGGTALGLAGDRIAGGSPYTRSSLSCSINVACQSSQGLGEIYGATIRINRGGSSTCTGVLVNNARHDRTPYVLTARHCGNPSVGDTLNWVFEFNYQSPACSDPAQTPVPQALTGAVVRAAKSNRADFALLELLQPVPESYNAYFVGWNLASTPPAQGIVVGHPRGDLKKLSMDTDPLGDAVDSWQGHFDHGTIEAGSSGSPLFNEQWQLVGHLRSAVSLSNTCSGPDGDDNQAIVLFPKLSYIWNRGGDGRRISDYLDPDGLGLTSLPTIAATTPPALHLDLKKVYRKTNGTKKAKLKWVANEVSTSKVDVYVAGIFVKKTDNDGVDKHTVTNAGDGPFEIYICARGSSTVCSNSVYAAYANALVLAEEDDEDEGGEAGKGGGASNAFTETPAQFVVRGNYPNPFNPTTTIQVDLPARAEVRVGLFDLLGRRAMVVPAQPLEAGAHRSITIDAGHLASGTYLYRVVATTASEMLVATGRMTLVR